MTQRRIFRFYSGEVVDMVDLLRWLARTFPVREVDYLKTERWKHKARAARKRADQRCQLCNSPAGPLEVHHRTYERLGFELSGDLIALCARCHGRHHGKG
jgi:5-methylcytosine-specific restriction endonuclease McrA